MTQTWFFEMAQNYAFAHEQDFRFKADDGVQIGDLLDVSFPDKSKPAWTGRVVEVRPNRGAAGTVMVVAVNE